MKPKTKNQKQVVEFSKKIKKITPNQISWIKENCFGYKAFVNKSGKSTCMVCGNEFKIDLSEINNNIKIQCLNCRKVLTPLITLTRKLTEIKLFSIIDRCENYQVVRYFKIIARFHKGKPANINVCQTSQIWLNPTGKIEIFSRCHLFSFYQEYWYGDFEIRNLNAIQKYELIPDFIYPKMKIIPQLLQRGFNGQFMNLAPTTLFKGLLLNPKIETLYKANQHNLISTFRVSMVNLYWASIKICIRQKYLIKDSNIFFDYLHLLQHFNKDLNNPFYVCPENLLEQHDLFVRRRDRQIKQERFELQKIKIKNDQIEYEIQKSKYFNLNFQKEDLNIKVINSVQHFYEIGQEHQHCLFTNEYHKKQTSLMLYATKNDTILETIEFSLYNFKVIQSYGPKNKETEHHSQIINLINKNKGLIKKLSKTLNFISN